MAVEIFFSYAHEDESLMNEVRRQLVIFERQGRIIKWHDRQIPPGTEWEAQIDDRLRSADIILLFVSPAFLESRYCYGVEVVAALQRHQQGEATVIPIVLRPCPWDVAPFAAIQALPQDGRPVTQWPDRDQVCLDVARSIINVADNIGTPGVAANNAKPISASANPSRGRKPERHKLPGDRIARIVVPFRPPTGTNIPPGYQPRLNQIASEIARDAAVRDGESFRYPAQFRGQLHDVKAFTERLGTAADALGIEADADKGQVEVWFEYAGPMSPKDMRALATANHLHVVHCGAWLVINP